LALVAIARPALGFLDTSQPPSQLFVLVDFSKSMTIQDESGKESRWQLLLRTLKKSEPALQRLREEQQVEVLFHKFAGDVEPFDPAAPGEADGKRTDYGAALRKLADGRDPRARLRGLLLIGDGADHGTAFPALGEAARWRGLPCRVHTFACGSPAT